MWREEAVRGPKLRLVATQGGGQAWPKRGRRGAGGRFGARSASRATRSAAQLLAIAGMMLLLTLLHAVLQDELVSRWTELVAPHSDAVPESQEPAGMGGAVAAARAMPICAGGRRTNCVVDGDTLWFAGEKIRLSGIDAPEVEGKCRAETEAAARATRRLSQLLSYEEITLRRSGQDRYGRTLAELSTGQGEVGAILVSEGLARPWTWRREGWCGEAKATF